MGEKAASSEVIKRLAMLFDYKNHHVRRSVCEALGKMGELAATSEVISGLVILLGDRIEDDKRSAFEAISNVAKKTAASEVLGVVLDVYNRGLLKFDHYMIGTMRNMLDRLVCLSDLNHDTVEKLGKFIGGKNWFLLRNIPPELLMRAFLDTKIIVWLGIIKHIFILRGYGITMTEMSVTMHSDKESVKLPFTDSGIGEQLEEYFVNCLDKPLHARE
jgi:hypothetical protein